MTSVSLEPTTELADAVARGTRRIREGGRLVEKLTPKQLREYEASKARHYVIRRRARSALAISDAYFRWCEGAKVPFVCIDWGRKYVTIKVDMIHLVPAQELRPDVLRELDALFRREVDPGFPGRWGETDRVLAVCYGIPRASAERVAAQMWTITTAQRGSSDSSPNQGTRELYPPLPRLIP